MYRFILTNILFLFLINYVNGQIYYTDFIPDRVLNNTTDTIDINGDGIDDLVFTQENNIPNQNANGVGVTLMHYDIEFIGNPPPYDPSHFYTYKLDSNILVDQNADNKSWVVKLGPNDAVRVMYMYFPNSSFHLGEWKNGVVDGYLGIRIKINNLWHYGWIRMDVTLYAQQLTIKDYAYNSIPEQGIYTNQKSSYKHNSLLVSYDNSVCSNRIFYQRNSFSKLAYDKVYKQNANGQFDSIGFVSASSPAVFIHSDSSLVTDSQKYRITPVDSANIEWSSSNTATSIYAKLIPAVNNTMSLKWTPLNDNNFSQYIIYQKDSLCSKFIALDSVPKNTLSYNIDSSILASSCNEYQIRIALDTLMLISGYGIVDTINSNIASPIIASQITPSAGFYYATIASGNIGEIQFYDTSKSNINSWQWDFGDGNFSNLQNPKHDFMPGVYTISLKVINCFGEDSITKVDYIDVLNGINSINYSDKVNIYPNPSNDKIVITSLLQNGENMLNISLLSIDSKLLFRSGRIGQSAYKLDLQDYKSGLYLLEIVLSNGVKTTKKLIINKNIN